MIFWYKGGERLKVREAIVAIEADGWVLVKTTGDHRQYKRPTKPGRVTIPGHLNDDLHPKTRDSIFRQAGLPKPMR
jgi:predicted RNA binding protein YcfA (HicA-like mRNA interferase family)